MNTVGSMEKYASQKLVPPEMLQNKRTVVTKSFQSALANKDADQGLSSTRMRQVDYNDDVLSRDRGSARDRRNTQQARPLRINDFDSMQSMQLR